MKGHYLLLLSLATLLIIDSAVGNWFSRAANKVKDFGVKVGTDVKENAEVG